MSAWAAFWLLLAALSLSLGVVPILEALRTWRDEGMQRKDGATEHYRKLFERELSFRKSLEVSWRTYHQELQNQQRGIRRLRGRLLKAQDIARRALASPVPTQEPHE